MQISIDYLKTVSLNHSDLNFEVSLHYRLHEGRTVRLSQKVQVTGCCPGTILNRQQN